MQIHSRKMNVSPDVNYEELARCTEDFNGAQCKAVCVEAGMIALRHEQTELKHNDYMDAILEVQAKKKKDLNYYGEPTSCCRGHVLTAALKPRPQAHHLRVHHQQIASPRSTRLACWHACSSLVTTSNLTSFSVSSQHDVLHVRLLRGVSLHTIQSQPRAQYGHLPSHTAATPQFAIPSCVNV
jgi:hypothetical protein